MMAPSTPVKLTGKTMTASELLDPASPYTKLINDPSMPTRNLLVLELHLDDPAGRQLDSLVEYAQGLVPNGNRVRSWRQPLDPEFSDIIGLIKEWIVEDMPIGLHELVDIALEHMQSFFQ